MKLVLIVLALLLVLLLIIIYIYWPESPAESFVYPEPIPMPPPPRIYEYTPQIDFTVLRPFIRQIRRHHRRRREESDDLSDISSDISTDISTDESDDTFEDHNHVFIFGGPDEIQQLVGLVNNIHRTTEPINQRPRNRQEETTEEFFQEMNDHNDDGQNVHNPQIRKSLTDRLLKVIEINGGIRQMYEVGGLEIPHDQYYQAKFSQAEREIRNRARQYHDGLVLRGLSREEADTRMQKIIMVLKKIEHGYDIVMTDNNSYKENFILVQVWDRINHSDNFAHRDQLQIALIDNLIDSVEERQAPIAAIEEFINNVLGTEHQPTGLEATHMTVCINGRVARVLTSLVLLDADESIAAPEKDEKEYTNEALYKASRIMDRELDTYEVKLPENQKSIREIYEEPDEDKLSQRERLVLRGFEDHLRETMAEEIHKDYDGLIPPEQITGIIAKAHAGI